MLMLIGAVVWHSVGINYIVVKRIFSYLVLILLAAYCVDLVWQFAHWHEAFAHIPWWGLVLGFMIRFAIMGGLVVLYFHLSPEESKPQVHFTAPDKPRQK